MICNYKAIVIGASAGGFKAIKLFLSTLDPKMNAPIIIIQHVLSGSDINIAGLYGNLCNYLVKEVISKEKITSGYVYLVPPNYHLLLEEDLSFTLSTEDKVSYARPSIDVTFECAAEIFKSSLVGVLLTGANEDGSKGLKKIQEWGGYTIVQNPETAEIATMPQSALNIMTPDKIIEIGELGKFINNLFLK